MNEKKPQSTEARRFLLGNRASTLPLGHLGVSSLPRSFMQSSAEKIEALWPRGW
jgi:hypothetical protein